MHSGPSEVPDEVDEVAALHRQLCAALDAGLPELSVIGLNRLPASPPDRAPVMEEVIVGRVSVMW